MIERVLVLDVGTSALKAVLFDRKGEIVASAEAGYGEPPAPHRHDVEAWWRAAREAIAGLGESDVDAVALTGTMENLIPVNAAGRPVFDAILYSDPCGAAALETLRGALDAIGAGRIVGNPPEPLMTAFKLAWLAEAHPEAAAAAEFFLPGAKDAVAMRLTGRAVTDPVTATTTGLMDLARRSWSMRIRQALALDAAKLPKILPAGSVIGEVQPSAARELGLPTDAPIPVINGCGDVGATTLGSFCTDPGDISVYLGTSGWVARVVPAGDIEPNGGVYRLAHPSPGLLIEVTPILSAGAAGTWIRSILGISTDERDMVLAEADRQPTDLIFLPYLAGERFPFLDTDVRGAFFGLDASHRRADLYYAVLEGVALAIRANLTAIDPAGTGRIRLVGGGATSAHLAADDRRHPCPAGCGTDLGRFRHGDGRFPHRGRDAWPRPGGRWWDTRLVRQRQERAGRVDRLARRFAATTTVARQSIPRTSMDERFPELSPDSPVPGCPLRYAILTTGRPISVNRSD